MRNSATQNPANKVGRNSGAGPAGISRIRPTEREAERGLRAAPAAGRPWAAIGAGVGAVLLAAGAAVLTARRRRQRGGLERVVDRMRDWL